VIVATSEWIGLIETTILAAATSGVIPPKSAVDKIQIKPVFLKKMNISYSYYYFT
jgi:hypothetical protein